MKAGIHYEFHHFGIPLQDGIPEGSFSEKAECIPLTTRVNSGFSGIASRMALPSTLF